MPVTRCALLGMLCATAVAQTIVTVAGVPYSHRSALEGKPALSAPLGPVYGLLLDKVTGRLLFHDESTVSRLEPDGSLTVLVGMGRGADGDRADGTPASGLRLEILRGMAQDASGALYLSEAALGRVYRVGTDGVVTTFAGGQYGITGNGDGGPATAVYLGSPRGLAFDSKGNLNIAEAGCACIRRVSPAGVLSTVYTLPQGPFGSSFRYLEGLAIDAQDNLFATGYSGSVVVRITRDGAATTVAGSGSAAFGGDGGPATAALLDQPSGVTLDAGGNLYIADTINQRVRRVAPDGTISTFAGTGATGFSGDGGPAVSATLDWPAQVLVDPAGNVYISDYRNRRVRRVSPDGVITTVAGSGVPDHPPLYPQIGDGGPALNASFGMVTRAIFDAAGNLLVSDGPLGRVRKITPDGTIVTIAGNFPGTGGDGGPATSAQLNYPTNLSLDTHGSIYVTSGDSRIRKITPDGTITAFAGGGAGTGGVRTQGDGGPAVNATLNEPGNLVVDAAGNAYIADSTNARIRVVGPDGMIRTLPGVGQPGVDYWNAVGLDPRGNLYVAMSHTERNSIYTVIERVTPDGTHTRVVGNGLPCSGPHGDFPDDGAQAAQAALCVVVGMTFDAQGTLYIPEAWFGAVLRVTPDGVIRRIAGTVAVPGGEGGPSLAVGIGDGGPALKANLGGNSGWSPSSVAVDAAGSLYLPVGVARIRKVMAAPLAVRLSQSSVDLQGGAAQPVDVATNVGEPFPYLVAVRTDDGGKWLSTSRVTGQTGEPLKVSANAGGLAAGVYRGTVTVKIGEAAADLRVTLTMR